MKLYGLKISKLFQISPTSPDALKGLCDTSFRTQYTQFKIQIFVLPDQQVLSTHYGAPFRWWDWPAGRAPTRAPRLVGRPLDYHCNTHCTRGERWKCHGGFWPAGDFPKETLFSMVKNEKCEGIEQSKGRLSAFRLGYQHRLISGGSLGRDSWDCPGVKKKSSFLLFHVLIFFWRTNQGRRRQSQRCPRPWDSSPPMLEGCSPLAAFYFWLTTRPRRRPNCQFTQ